MISANIGSAYSTGFQITTPTSRAADAEAAAQATADGTAPVGVKVNLSTTAIEKSKAAAADAADSTDPVKVLEKRIKEIQKQVAEAQARLAAIESDKHLTPEQKQTEAGTIQGQLAQLNGALTAAMTSLAKLLAKQAQPPAS